jgi:defect in organelle trafficking protein DotC
MKRTLLAGLLCTLALPVLAEPAINDTAPPDMNTYMTPGDSDHDGVSDTDYQMLTDAGRTVGFQGGKAQRSWELAQVLKTRDADLSRLYDFRPLISRQGYLPPVIDLATDMAHITPDQIRTAYRTYHIIVPARFVSNPPGWRTYLLAGLSGKNSADPDARVQPKDSHQMAIWQDAISAGWKEGRESADQTLEANFSRLTRDYTGMLRYSALLQQGMIEAPDVAEQQQSVTGDRNQLLIGDKVKRMKDPAGFVTDKQRWQPVIHVGN